MHLQTVIPALMACAIGQAYAAPYFPMTVKSLTPILGEIKGRQLPSAKATFSLRDVFLSGRDKAALPVSAASPALTMEQLESEQDPAFRKRDMSSAVSANINTLMEKETITGSPGYAAFANAIMAAGAKVKRSVDLVTRYLECGGSELCIKAREPVPKNGCGGHAECIRARQPQPEPMEECGGWTECIKARQPQPEAHPESEPVDDDGGCGGHAECIKARQPQPEPEKDEGGCGGHAECIKARELATLAMI